MSAFRAWIPWSLAFGSSDENERMSKRVQRGLFSNLGSLQSDVQAEQRCTETASYPLLDDPPSAAGGKLKFATAASTQIANPQDGPL